MQRSQFLRTLAGAASLLPAAGRASAAGSTSAPAPAVDPAHLPLGRQPNIVYVVVHDLGTHLGCYGTQVRSPHLDRIARDGVTLDRFFCSSAVCSPSRGCAMTGLHAHANGIIGLTHFGWRYHPGVRTAPEYLADLGYHAVRVGYSHEGEEMNTPRRWHADHAVNWRCTQAENAVDDAIWFLRHHRETSDTRPFYLNVAMMETHPTCYLNETSTLGRAGRLPHAYGGPIPVDEVTVPPQLPDTPQVRRYLARFESCIRFMDAEIGRLYAQFLDLGYGRDSLFIFTTDHGMNGPRGKGSLYDHGLSIAGLFRPPDPLRQPGLRLPHLLQNIDVVPTLIDAAGGTPPPHLHGKSFWPALTGAPFTPHDALFAEWNCGGDATEYFPMRSVRTDRFRYLRHLTPRIPHRLIPSEWSAYPPPPETSGYPYAPWPRVPNRPPGSPAEELYDMQQDPHGLVDVASHPAYADARRDLASRLDAWMPQVRDIALDPTFQPATPAAPGFQYLEDRLPS